MQNDDTLAEAEERVAVRPMPVERVASFIGPTGIDLLASAIAAVRRNFPAHRFTRAALTGIEHLSLFRRADHVARVLNEMLDMPFPKFARVLVDASGAPRTQIGYGPMENFRLLAFTRSVSTYGLGHFEDSMWALQELTKRFTAEFDVRPFLIVSEERTLHTLRGWLEHESVHVRRLVSESSRTRLPWGVHLRSLQRKPATVLALIERLNNDPSPYVQKSVANNLADIIKDDETAGLAAAERWAATGHDVTRKIVHHAVRYPAKQGCVRAKALRFFG